MGYYWNLKPFKFAGLPNMANIYCLLTSNITRIGKEILKPNTYNIFLSYFYHGKDDSPILQGKRRMEYLQK